MILSDVIAEIGVVLAIIAATLMITLELLSPFYGKVNIRINRKRLNQTAWAAIILFLTTMVIRISFILFE